MRFYRAPVVSTFPVLQQESVILRWEARSSLDPKPGRRRCCPVPTARMEWNIQNFLCRIKAERSGETLLQERYDPNDHDCDKGLAIKPFPQKDGLKDVSYLTMMYFTSLGSSPNDSTSCAGLFKAGSVLNTLICTSLIRGGYMVKSYSTKESASRSWGQRF